MTSLGTPRKLGCWPSHERAGCSIYCLGPVGSSGARKMQALLNQSVRLDDLGIATLKLSWMQIFEETSGSVRMLEQIYISAFSGMNLVRATLTSLLSGHFVLKAHKLLKQIIHVLAPV